MSLVCVCVGSGEVEGGGDLALEDDASVLEMLAVVDAPVHPAVAPEVADKERPRSVIDLVPGTFSFKVWFDSCTGGTGRRRGWCCCFLHSCIKYRLCSVDPDRFFVGMALLQQRGLGDPALTRKTHLEFWPLDADIDAALPRSRITPF